MDPSAASQELFDLWKRQIEEGTQAWARMMAAVPGRSAPDPAAFWRPLMDQGVAAWSRIMSQGPASPDLFEQWKQFLDQWIEAWSKALGQAMGTEAFAQMLGAYLDRWLQAQGPAKKAGAESAETVLQALGLPSRAQVVGVARQLAELDDRLERLEDGIAALLRRRDGKEPQ
jgi:Poly(R)-hydroxyalkanoic acid synthase subunit (PHA_synth_III_E)